MEAPYKHFVKIVATGFLNLWGIYYGNNVAGT